MKDWLYRLTGFDPASVPEGADLRFVWTHAPSSWMALVWIGIVLALLYGAYRLYSREMASCPVGVKRLLAALRILSIVVLALVFLGPAAAVTLRQVVEPLVLVLLDDSASMSLPACHKPETAARVAAVTGQPADTVLDRPPSRAAVVESLLSRDDYALPRSLRRRGHVRVFTVADTVEARDLSGLPELDGTLDRKRADVVEKPPSPIPPLEAKGAATDLGRGIREAIQSASGRSIAGIVVISDGQNNTGDDPLGAAEFAAAGDIPILTVGVGDPERPQNLRVAEVWAPESVFRGDPFAVRARIEGEPGMSASTPVELVERRADGGEEDAGTVVARKTAELAAEDPRSEVVFQHEPKNAGSYVYTVRILPGERDLDTDNADSVAVNVLSEKIRVLIVAGAPMWDFLTLRTLTTRDKTLDVSCWLQSQDPKMPQDGNTVIPRLPESLQEVFKYDVIVLMDPNPDGFPREWVDWLRRFMEEHAGGLLWVAGPKYTGAFLSDPRTRAIAEMLPVRFSGVERLLGRRTDENEQEWPLQVTPAGADNPLLVVDPDPRGNVSGWRGAPGVLWSFPSREAKPGASVLIEHSAPHMRGGDGARPLLVTSRYGAGRCVYLGFNGVWRWRRMGESFHDRFWVNTIRYLVEGRLLGARKRGRISTDRSVYSVGAIVSVTAQVYDPTYAPMTEPTLDAVSRGAGGQLRDVQLRLVAGKPGVYEGSLTATHLGIHEIELRLSDPGRAQPIRVTGRYRVELPRVEFADTRMNVKLLGELAERSGGRAFALDQTAGLADALRDRRQTLTVPERPRNLWDHWRLMTLLAVLLGAEWAIRKKYRLL